MDITKAPKIELFNKDCMEGMRSMADNEYTLAIVDPPYGIGAEQGTNQNTREKFKNKEYGWDKEIPDNEYFSELKRVSKQQIIWGGNYFPGLFPSRSFLIWDKGETCRFRCFADCELAYTSINTSARVFTYNVNTTTYKFDPKIHPTQKPVQLYKWILTKFAHQGNRILDTHLGSGSIVIACYDLGFDLTGFEIDKDYFKALTERFENHKKQLQFGI